MFFLSNNPHERKCAYFHHLIVSLSYTMYAHCKMTLVSSQAEVDALIEMVSRLKTEKESYKLETRRLWRVLQDYGLGGQCLASSAVSPVLQDCGLGGRCLASSAVSPVLQDDGLGGRCLASSAVSPVLQDDGLGGRCLASSAVSPVLQDDGLGGRCLASSAVSPVLQDCGLGGRCLASSAVSPVLQDCGLGGRCLASSAVSLVLQDYGLGGRCLASSAVSPVLQDDGLGGRCLASSAVSPVEEDIVLAASLVDRLLLYGHRRSGTMQPMQVPSGTTGVDEDVAANTFEVSSTPSPERCRRASTVSSYLSSSRSSSAADVSSSDDLLGGSECDSLIGAGVKLPLLRGFNGLRVTDIDGERLDNVVAMFDGYFTDNNGKCYECHQQADVATVYDSIESPDGATGCHGPLRYARRVSRQKRARMCNKVNFIMHI